MRANCCRFLLCLLIAFVEFPSDSYEEELFLGRFPIPNKQTNSPINIITEKTKYVDYRPIEIRGNSTEPMKIINTGKTIEVINENTNKLSRSSVTGGVLLDDHYVYEKTQFLWTDNKNGAAGVTINGKGFPIQATGRFYNTKYQTFKNALNYRDGIASIIFPITICPTPSSTFSAFAKELKKVLLAGTCAYMQLLPSYQWYNLIPTNATYYAYPGSYPDFETGKKYYCETVIVPEYSATCISPTQFDETFGKMKNFLGLPLTSKEQAYPFRDPVVQGKGLGQVLMYPFS